MNCFLISGFLGSGKTTLILVLAKRLVEEGIKKVGIIVNEIGKIGIDGDIIKQLDLNTWELFGSCICCTLGPDLLKTIEEIDQRYKCDLVLIEPTGVADPQNILNLLNKFKGGVIKKIISLVVLDPTRFSILNQMMTPLLTSQIKAADILLINKTDISPLEELTFTRRSAGTLNPEADILEISAIENKGIEPLVKIIIE